MDQIMAHARSLLLKLPSVVVIGALVLLIGSPVVEVLLAQDDGGNLFVSSVEISPRVHSLNPCEAKQFGFNVKNKLGNQIKDAKVVWESTDPKVAEVKEDGTVVGVNPGHTFIRARNGKTKSNVSSVFVRDKGTRRC